MYRVRTCLVVLLAVALALPMAPPAAVSAADPSVEGSSKGGDGDASLAALAGLSITSPGPLSSITISPDLNCAVNHVADTVGEFYGDTACDPPRRKRRPVRPGVHPGRRLGRSADGVHPCATTPCRT